MSKSLSKPDAVHVNPALHMLTGSLSSIPLFTGVFPVMLCWLHAQTTAAAVISPLQALEQQNYGRLSGRLSSLHEHVS